MKNLFSGFKLRNLIWFCHIRKLQNKSSLIQKQIKIFDISCMVCHKSIKVIFKTFNTVKVYSGHPAVIKEPLLIIHMMFVKQGNCLICIHTSLHNRQVGICDFMHSLFYTVNKLLGKGSSALHGKIISMTHRIMDHYFIRVILPCHIINRFQQDQACAPFISLVSYGIPGRDKLNRTVCL